MGGKQSSTKRTLDKTNCDSLKEEPINNMSSPGDSSSRDSSSEDSSPEDSSPTGLDANIFVKNLDKNIDNTTLHSIFSTFGSILSWKVATDEEGNSKGYGFIQYESEEDAHVAIQKANGRQLNGKKLYVTSYIPRDQRKTEISGAFKRYRNVFVKNFGTDVTEEDLRELFEPYGSITSLKIMVDEKGKSRGFGFCNFDDPDDAENAVEELNGEDLNGDVLFVGPAQKQAERKSELKWKFEQLKIERELHNREVNLYVKNLDASINDERLRKLFSAFGTITSAKVMVKEGKSKQFGFVSFSSPEEATKAISKMNGHIIAGKPLYVALAQEKKERKAQLQESRFKNKVAKQMQQMPQMQACKLGSSFLPPIIQAQRGFFPSVPVSQVRTDAIWTTHQQLRAQAQAGHRRPVHAGAASARSVAQLSKEAQTGGAKQCAAKFRHPVNVTRPANNGRHVKANIHPQSAG